MSYKSWKQKTSIHRIRSHRITSELEIIKNELNQDMKIRIGNNEIEQISQIKYQRIILNDKLNLEDEVSSCVRKMPQKINIMRRSQKSYPNAK